MSPIAGFTRFRQWAFSGAQSAHGTASAPTEAVPWRGTPSIEPNWTDNDSADVGSIDEFLSPYRTHTDTTVTLTGLADFNKLVLPLSGGLRGGVTPTGGGPYTWTHQALSLTATTLDEFSAQWGDDYGKDDYRFRDGIVESFEWSFGDDLGPAQISTTWYFGNVDPHVTRVANLTIGSNLPLMFGADTKLYINSTAGAIGTTQISDAVHSGRVRITNTIDKKRFANGSNSRFAVAGFGLAEREIEAEFTFAKADAISGFASTSEMRQWLAADPVTRYISMVVESREIAGGSTPYSWTLNLPLTWRTRGDGELSANTTVTLMGRGRYDAALGYSVRSVTVNSNASLP